MDLPVTGPLWYWRGPAPFHFVTVPEREAEMIASTAGLVSYGWGMIPVTVLIGRTRYTTSLWPKDGGYIVPVKAAVRKAETLDLDDVVTMVLTVAT